MSKKLLNTEHVKTLMKDRGLTVSDLYEKLEISLSAARSMFRDGLLLNDLPRRNKVLKKLASILRTTVDEIVTEYYPRRSGDGDE